MPHLLQRLLPELTRFPEHQRAAALRRARDQELDAVELVGAAVALLVATVVTRFALDDLRPAPGLVSFLLNLALAVPILLVLFLPFHLRRLRRGLRSELEKGGSP